MAAIQLPATRSTTVARRAAIQLPRPVARMQTTRVPVAIPTTESQGPSAARAPAPFITPRRRPSPMATVARPVAGRHPEVPERGDGPRCCDWPLDRVRTVQVATHRANAPGHAERDHELAPGDASGVCGQDRQPEQYEEVFVRDERVEEPVVEGPEIGRGEVCAGRQGVAEEQTRGDRGRCPDGSHARAP